MPTTQLTPPKSTGLAKHASTAAFGPARAITSHVRNFYLVCYHGRCRRPRLTFFIDTSLLAIAAILVLAVIWIARMPAVPPGIAVTLRTPPINAAAPIPMAATVRSANGTVQNNVRIWWRLPPGTQILSAEPSLSADGGAFLGTVQPGTEVTSRIVARFLSLPGEQVNIGLAAWSEDNDGLRQYAASEPRDVVGVALDADIPSAFQEVAMTSKGVTLPIRIENKTSELLPFVHLRIVKNDDEDKEERVVLGDLGARESRWVFVPVVPNGPTARVDWYAGVASREITSGAWESSVISDGIKTPQVSGELSAKPGLPLRIAWTSGQAGDELIVVHPLLAESVVRVPVDGRAQEATLSAPALRPGANHEWFVTPVTLLAGGARVLGPSVMGTTAVPLPLKTEVRYYSSSGDQLGAGPHPPQATLETRYWVFWTVGPMDNPLQDIHVTSELAPGVRATGAVSASDGGTVTITDRMISWSLPASDPATAGKNSAMFGIEIAIEPTVDEIGRPIPLILRSAASAADTHTSLTFEGSDGMHTTAFEE